MNLYMHIQALEQHSLEYINGSNLCIYLNGMQVSTIKFTHLSMCGN